MFTHDIAKVLKSQQNNITKSKNKSYNRTSL